MLPDPKGLNKAIERERFHIKTREEICAELSGAKYFSQLDLKSAYWQIQLDVNSKLLTTFGTPFGRYMYNVLPFGLDPASEICQKRVEKFIIQDQPGALAHQDNILVWGKDVEEHDFRLKKSLDNVCESGAKLREDKCDFRVAHTIFLGKVLTDQGIRPDTTKVKAITEIGAPSNVTVLQSILGMINFFSKFVPNLAVKTKSMRCLLTKCSVWSWDANHQRELDEIKTVLTSSPLLCLFDPSKPHKLSTASSKYGLGCVLLQEEFDGWHTGAYASRSMNEAEKEYVQVEKEALAITWGIIRFHSYLYGHRFQVETDNKPLGTIFERGLLSAPARIQGFMLKLQCYDFVLQWTPRRYMRLEDALSKIHTHSDHRFHADVIYHIDSVINEATNRAR